MSLSEYRRNLAARNIDVSRLSEARIRQLVGERPLYDGERPQETAPDDGLLPEERALLKGTCPSAQPVYKLLRHAAEVGEVCPSYTQIVDRLNVDAKSVAKAMNQMEERGLIQRSRTGVGARMVVRVIPLNKSTTLTPQDRRKRDEKILRLCRQGKRPFEIAAQLGVSKNVVIGVRRKQGLDKPKVAA